MTACGHQIFLFRVVKNKPRLDIETYEWAAEIVRIGNLAVRKAQEENRRLGLPNVYSRNGKLIYEMPDGSIVVKDIQEKNQKDKE